MTTYSVLIADDEAPARERMRTLLSQFNDISIVGEVANGQEALVFCQVNKVDLIFLDIQMPGLSGLDAADWLKDRTTEVVFVTAFGEHALEAFDLQALDYLTKPVRPSRLEKTMERFRNRVPRPAVLDDRIGVPVGNKTKLLDVKELIFARVTEGSLELHCTTKTYFVAWTLRNLEDALGNRPGFFKINRQELINLLFLSSIEQGNSSIILKDGTELDVSRSASKRLREILKM